MTERSREDEKKRIEMAAATNYIVALHAEVKAKKAEARAIAASEAAVEATIAFLEQSTEAAQTKLFAAMRFTHKAVEDAANAKAEAEAAYLEVIDPT